MARNKTVDQILRNGWAQLAILHPETNVLLQYRDGEFVPYHPESNKLKTAASSLDCYRGRRDNLPFAVLQGKSTS